VGEVIDVRERRIRQFQHYLDLMEHRTLRLEKADCFVIFFRRLPAEFRRRVSAGERFVQFAFFADEFHLDLPDTTLTPEEANRAVAERPGLRFVLGDPSREPADLERKFDPIQRTYRYGEQRAAAEDTAYVFFDLWGLSLDAWIKVKAKAFESGRQWERGFSLD
jgi:hypothetical protein